MSCEYCESSHEILDPYFEPRRLFTMALEDDLMEYRIKRLDMGVTDIVIKKKRNSVYLKVLVGEQGYSGLKEDYIEKPHIQAMEIDIKPKRNEWYEPLFEIDDNQFYGREIADEFLEIYTDDVSLAVATILNRLFEIFPQFVNHVYILIPDKTPDEILTHLSVSEGFQRLQELTVLKDMNEGYWYLLMKNLKEVKKVNMGKLSRIGDISMNDTITHVRIADAHDIRSEQFLSFDNQIIEIHGYSPVVRDIIEFLELWKNGQKADLKRLSLKFRRPLRIAEKEELQMYLDGVKRSEKPKNEEMKNYEDDTCKIVLDDAYDIKTDQYSASYLLKLKSFQFFAWKSYCEEEEDMEF